jgi:hypothetical protein
VEERPAGEQDSGGTVKFPLRRKSGRDRLPGQLVMSKTVSYIFVIGGIALLFFGYNEAQSLHSGVIRVFTGSPSDKAVWMMAAGAIALGAGLLGLSKNTK